MDTRYLCNRQIEEYIAFIKESADGGNPETQLECYGFRKDLLFVYKCQIHCIIDIVSIF